jgi:hypothetical protein
MPSTIRAAEPESAARTLPREQPAADDHIPAATSSIEAARQAAAERPRHCAAGEAA